MGLFRELRYELSSLIFGLGILGMIFSLTKYLIPIQSPDWLQSIHRAVGNYVVWEAFLGLVAVRGVRPFRGRAAGSARRPRSDPAGGPPTRLPCVRRASGVCRRPPHLGRARDGPRSGMRRRGRGCPEDRRARVRSAWKSRWVSH